MQTKSHAQRSNGHDYLLAPLALLAGLLLACPSASTSNDNSALILALASGAAGGSSSGCPAASGPATGTYLADTVISAPGATGQGFKNSSLAVNGICGGGTSSGSTDVYELDQTGAGATLTLGWSSHTVMNGSGVDFIVFENAFYQNGNSSIRFMEAVIVEVRDDITGRWCGFTGLDYNPGGPETTYSTNPAHWIGFAGVTPTLYNQVFNALSASAIFDPSQGGGDGFDLSNLASASTFGNDCNSTARTNILANGLTQVRLHAASSKTNPDSGSAFPVDTAAFDDGPDIDGVLARY